MSQMGHKQTYARQRTASRSIMSEMPLALSAIKGGIAGS
jgi:hypothetical protein